jgi:hypothetical protein
MADGLFTFGTQELVELDANGPEYVNDATAKAPVGVLCRYNGNVYRYVLLSSASAAATVANSPAYWAALAPASGTFTVSADYADSIAGVNGIAGFFGNKLDSGGSYVAATAGYYIWVQVGGVILTCKTFSDSSMYGLVGAKVIGYASDLTLGYVAAASTTTANTIGIVLGSIDITNKTAKVLLQNLIW